MAEAGYEMKPNGENDFANETKSVDSSRSTVGRWTTSRRELWAFYLYYIVSYIA